jgi:hypothetical protein
MEMLTVANEYCHFVEKAYQYEIDDILSYLQKILPLLYLKGSLVPRATVKNPEANERFVTEENYEIIFNELRNKFKPKDEFWLIENTDGNDNEPVKASVAEHLTDIYQDLKDFILLYAKGTESAKENAVHDVKVFFENHWGIRLVQSQNYIHSLLYQGKKKNQNPLL